MATNLSQDGQIINYTCTGNNTAGTLYEIGSTLGVALKTGTTGDVIPIAIEGVFSGLTKVAEASSAIAVGEVVYYRVTGGAVKLTGAASLGTFAGVGFAAAVTGATTATIKLLGAPGPTAATASF
jgi:predicted RecA/RadA family phage recombinase